MLVKDILPIIYYLPSVRVRSVRSVRTEGVPVPGQAGPNCLPCKPAREGNSLSTLLLSFKTSHGHNVIIDTNVRNYFPYVLFFF